MEKRFFAFLVLSFGVMTLYIAAQLILGPKPPVAQGPKGENGAEQRPAAPAPDPAAPDPAAPDPAAKDDTPSTPSPKPPPETTPPTDPTVSEAPEPDRPLSEKIPSRRVSLGSAASDSPYPLLVTLNSRGASIERVELTARNARGGLWFRNLERRSGYLGQLALEDVPDAGGCRIQVVGSGTPAAQARRDGNSSAEGGLQIGDIIQAVNDTPVRSKSDLDEVLRGTRPGQTVNVSVTRKFDGKSTVIKFSVTLDEWPLELIRPENSPKSDKLDPLSCLFSLHSIDGKANEDDHIQTTGLASLRQRNWEVSQPGGDGAVAEFRLRLTGDDLAKFEISGPLEIVRRYSLIPVPKSDRGDRFYPAYHIGMEIEIRNLGTDTHQVAYRLDGPNGLPLEGWWYQNKINPQMFASAGARDVVWRPEGQNRRLLGTSKIHGQAVEEPTSPEIPLFDRSQPELLDFTGTDTLYFAAVLLPDKTDAEAKLDFLEADALTVGDVSHLEKARIRKANTSFRLISKELAIEPGQSLRRSFVLFAGPKQPDLLAAYRLGDLVEYGWFGMVSRPLTAVLHFFYSVVRNYGIAIIMLTVLVRGCMFPISRKAAKNAQMMQELAPEMKKIAEKYKNDMEKRGQAQKELFAKHNYNPFGGCLLMFLQLPVFIGLYRGLSVDIELRQAALIPGLQWCSNLAGPDMLFRWDTLSFMPEFIVGEGTGWLGPYFNILPIVTIFLFLMQQKLFTPPATDEQSRMQQQMMKYMMIFMGVLFFKVPSGLCVYFIASSMWGIAERKLLPKLPKPGEAPPETPPKKKSNWLSLPTAKSDSNGSSGKARARKRQRRK